MRNFVETWKGIAHHIGRSERWCRYTSAREDDPLPVFKVGGIVRLDLEDYAAWLERQRNRTLSRGEALGIVRLRTTHHRDRRATLPLRPCPEQKPLADEVIETWKNICALLDRSEGWCRHIAARARDPLPVFKGDNVVKLRRGDYEKWLARERQRTRVGRCDVSSSLVAAGGQR